MGEPEGDTRTITYADLQAMVCQAANALVELGVEAGDRVAIYMPMIPETVVAMLACARLGAPHSVVFGGFSAEALAGRILDADARVVITADGGYRRGHAVAAEGERRRGARRGAPTSKACSSSGGPAKTSAWHEGSRRLVARPGRTPAARARARVLRRRAAALHHVHERHDGQAEGDPPHDGRVPGRTARRPTG